MSSAGGPAEAAWLNLLLFSVGGVSFGVDLEQVDGMAGHAGEVAADLHWLHDLPGFIGLTVPYRLPTVLSIRTENRQPYRVIIDAMEEIAEFRWTEISPLPLLLEARLLKCGIWGILQRDGRIVLLVDFQRIVRNN